MGFFDKLKKGLSKTRENITNKIEKLIIGLNLLRSEAHRYTC